MSIVVDDTRTATSAGTLHAAPAPAAVRETLEMILGRGVTVCDAGWAPPAGAVPVAVAPYADDTGTLRGCAWVDLPLAAALGAAMGMVPAARVAHCVGLGVVVPDFQDSLREVLDVASALLNVGDAPRLRVGDLDLLEKDLRADVLALLADPRAAGYYSVGIEGYGTGLMSFTLA